jgi:MoaA/NifB/PqqE/SkfB family radical SAM enzyme
MGLSKYGFLRLIYRHPLYVKHLFIKKIKFRNRFRWTEKYCNSGRKVPEPLVYKFILSLKCNLRCKICMLWGDEGRCRHEPEGMSSKEMDWGVLSRIVNKVSHSHPSFILSGGEPLLYSHFEDLANLLRKNRCFAYICTNGTLIHKFKNLIARNPYLVFLISLDGLKNENDLLRGKGCYDKVIENIKLLRSLKHPPYVGIQFTFSSGNAHIMRSFCREMAGLGVDWVLLNPQWFISGAQAEDYENFITKQFNVMPSTHLGYKMPCNLDKDGFVRQLTAIKKEVWPMQISCYLDKPEDIRAYIDNPGVPTGNTFCYKQWLRADLSFSGDVSPCIQFPDLYFGNIKEKDIMEIWNSKEYAKFRKIIITKYMPLCSKCDAIYLYDAKRKYL